MKNIKIKVLIVILIIAAVVLIIRNPFRERYKLPFDGEKVDSVVMYRENDVEYKELTEQKDIQKILSILTSLKIYEHDPEDPQGDGVLNMTFDMHLTDGTVETISFVESGFGYLTDKKQKLKVSYLEPAAVWNKFSGGMTFIKDYIEYSVYDTEKDLVNAADLIFHGVVTKVEYKMLDAKTGQEPADISYMDELGKIPYAYTLYTVKADQVYKGDSANEEITVACPGGVFEDTTYVVRRLADTEEEEQEIPEIIEGEDYLFLVREDQTFYPELLNPIQGVYGHDSSEAINIEEILESKEPAGTHQIDRYDLELEYNAYEKDYSTELEIGSEKIPLEIWRSNVGYRVIKIDGQEIPCEHREIPLGGAGLETMAYDVTGDGKEEIVFVEASGASGAVQYMLVFGNTDGQWEELEDTLYIPAEN